MNKQDAFPKPDILISKCIEFDHCRYNGDMITSEVVKKLKPYVNFTTFCPEVETGLGVPRYPVRLVREKSSIILYQPATGKIVTDKMQKTIQGFLDKKPVVQGFILKNSSPTCGINNVKIYKGFKKGASVERGRGLFAQALIDSYPNTPMEDEGRLRNFIIRENFYTRIFTLAKFNKIRKENKIKVLIDFHSKNKYLFMAYNQKHLKKLGKIVANHEKKQINTVLDEYEKELKALINSSTSTGALINAIQHCFGGFSGKIEKQEKEFFLNSLEEYRDERIPLTAVIQVLKSYAVRFNLEYLLNQTLLNPFPSGLEDVNDSGNVRRYR